MVNGETPREALRRQAEFVHHSPFTILHSFFLAWSGPHRSPWNVSQDAVAGVPANTQQDCIMKARSVFA